LAVSHSRTTLSRFIAGALFLGLLSGLKTQAQAQAQLPPISAPQWVVQHWQDSVAWQAPVATTLAARNADQPAQPASLTKLMTAYAVLNLTGGSDAERKALLTVSADCAATEGTRVGYRVGEKVAIEDALQGLLAISGNDAACALAQHFDPVVAGMKAHFSANTTPPLTTQRCPRLEDAGDFVAYMNALSVKLSLCQWRNPHGLSQDGHLSTAKDVATIAHALWHEFPFARPWLGRKTYAWNGLTQANRNTLLHRDAAVDGLKTGHTNAAGYNLATTQSQRVTLGSDHYDWRLTTVVLGTTSAQARADDSAALLAWARANYQPWRVYVAGDLAGQWPLKGAASAVPLHLNEPLWVVLDKTVNPQALRYEFLPEPKLSTPYPAGSTLGRMTAYLGAEVVGSAALITQAEVRASPWYAFAWAWVKSLFS
jgi:serine-type D-Ala-D-Ala carboxypeptidase (penicillin-binding protein 5/6)